MFGGLVRPNGFFLAGPLALAAATVFVPRLAWGRPVFVVGRTSPRGSSGVGSERFIPAAVALTPVLGMLVHSASLCTLTGRPFAWFDAHAAWGRSAAGVCSLVADHGGYLLDHGVSGYIV